ncbi:MAG: carbohydrate ABC transporter permease [Pseudomonadales bacterium]
MIFSSKKHLLTLLLPALAVLIIFAIYPVIQVTIYSFMEVDFHAGESEFVGLQNYRDLLDDWFFVTSVGNTVKFSLIASIAQVALGLLLAILFNRSFPGKRFALPIVIYPMMLSTLVCSAIWRSWYHYDFGMLNYWLTSVGLSPVEWLFDPSLALYSVILVDIWQWTPMTFLIVLAGLQSIPKDISEAARSDGANEWQVLWHITLPMIKGHILLALLLRTLDTFKLFDKVYALTGGGPGNATETMSVFVYRNGFKFFEIGLASAASVFMLVIACALSILYASKILGEQKK